MHSTHLGIVFAGTVNCKSDNANPAAQGQTGANPGQIKSTDYPDESSSRIDLELASMENWLNQPANYVPWYSSGGFILLQWNLAATGCQCTRRRISRIL